jgi:hypothetical protein
VIHPSSAPAPADVNACAIALYPTDAHQRPALTEHEFTTLVHQGTRSLGHDQVAALARQLNGIDTAWIHGILTDEDYNALRGAAVGGDLDRFERCYGHALGEPYP